MLQLVNSLKTVAPKRSWRIHILLHSLVYLRLPTYTKAGGALTGQIKRYIEIELNIPDCSIVKTRRV